MKCRYQNEVDCRYVNTSGMDMDAYCESCELMDKKVFKKKSYDYFFLYLGAFSLLLALVLGVIFYDWKLVIILILAVQGNEIVQRADKKLRKKEKKEQKEESKLSNCYYILIFLSAFIITSCNKTAYPATEQICSPRDYAVYKNYKFNIGHSPQWYKRHTPHYHYKHITHKTN